MGENVLDLGCAAVRHQYSYREVVIVTLSIVNISVFILPPGSDENPDRQSKSGNEHNKGINYPLPGDASVKASFSEE